MADHLHDPLDYLYEEYPPEAMAEARKHLAACPECRADMRAVRETVRQYRQALKPAAPEGLAARVTRTALEVAARERGKPTPAEEQSAAVPAAASTPATPTPAQPERPVRPASRALSPQTVSPALFGRPSVDVDIEAEFARLKEEVIQEIPKGWRAWLFHPAWTVAASVIFVCALGIHFSPRMRATETRFLPSMPQRDASSSQTIRGRERLPASHARAASDGIVSAVAAPILQEAAVMNEIVELPPFTPGTADTAEKRMARAAPVALAAPAVASAESSPEVEERAEAASPAETPEPERLADATEAAAPSPADPIPAEMLEALGKKTAAAAVGAPVVIMNLPDADEAPHLIERPLAYDAGQRIQTLTTLAGMQMAAGEFGDARKTVVLLETYDGDAARALSRTLGQMEEAEAERKQEEAARAEAKAESARIESERKAEEAKREEEKAEREREEAARKKAEAEREKEEAQREKAKAERKKATAEQEKAEAERPPVPREEAQSTEEAQPVSLSTEESPPIAPASLPPYAHLLETVEPPEDPPMSTVRVYRPDMAYSSGGIHAIPATSVPYIPAPAGNVPPSAPVFSPVVFPEPGETLALPPLEPVETMPDTYVSLEDDAAGNATEAEVGADDEPVRSTVRESVYVDTPAESMDMPAGSAGTSTGIAGDSTVLTPPPPLAVYVPVIPHIVTAPPPARTYSPPSRATRRRPFTTDPYFRD